MRAGVGTGGDRGADVSFSFFSVFSFLRVFFPFHLISPALHSHSLPSHPHPYQPPHPPRPPLQPHLLSSPSSPGKPQKARPPLAALERAVRGVSGRGPPRLLVARVAFPELKQIDLSTKGGPERLRQALEALCASEQARPFGPLRSGISLSPRGALPLWQRNFRIAERAFLQGKSHETDEAPALG